MSSEYQDEISKKWTDELEDQEDKMTRYFYGKGKPPRRIIRDRMEFDNTYHPGVESTDLNQIVHGHLVAKAKPKPDRVEEPVGWGPPPEELCCNCGYNSYHIRCGYTSRVKLCHIRDNSAIWDLGPKGPWMLKDEANTPNNNWKTDYATQQFLKKAKPNLPLVEMHKFGGPDDKFHFTIMSRAKGSLLAEILPTLTTAQKEDVLEHLGECIKEWRQIQRPRMEKVDGSGLLDLVIGKCKGLGCIKIGRDEEEWLENLTPAMRKDFLFEIWCSHRHETVTQATQDSWVKDVDEKIAKMKADFPRGGPYVLTHGDLNPRNIFISDDNEEKKFKISAIIDWESAGFYPWWVERCRAGPLLGQFTQERSHPYGYIVHPGYTDAEFDKIEDIIHPLREAWEGGGGLLSSLHKPQNRNEWFSEKFCACKPYCRLFSEVDFGEEDVHLDLFDIESTDSEDTEHDYPYRKFDDGMRQFLRWFNKISNYKSKDVGSSSSGSIKIIY